MARRINSSKPPSANSSGTLNRCLRPATNPKGYVGIRGFRGNTRSVVRKELTIKAHLILTPEPRYKGQRFISALAPRFRRLPGRQIVSTERTTNAKRWQETTITQAINGGALFRGNERVAKRDTRDVHSKSNLRGSACDGCHRRERFKVGLLRYQSIGLPDRVNTSILAIANPIEILSTRLKRESSQSNTNPYRHSSLLCCLCQALIAKRFNQVSRDPGLCCSVSFFLRSRSLT